jgi:phosphoribosylglycinamide formyltransferase-1
MILRLAILTSSSAPGLESLITCEGRGSIFEICAVVTSETSFAQMELVERARIPMIMRPLRVFCQERAIPVRSMKARHDFDVELVEALAPFAPDCIILTGYRYIAGAPLLASFRQKLIALHDGDLTRRDEHGRRLLTGLHAVRDALLEGAQETRTTAFFVTEDVGEGPLLLLSAPYPVAALARDAQRRGDADLLFAYADLHRRWMRRDACGPMLVQIAELLAAGTVQIIGDVAWIDGAPGPCRFGEAPSLCSEGEIVRGIPASCPFISR